MTPQTEPHSMMAISTATGESEVDLPMTSGSSTSFAASPTSNGPPKANSAAARPNLGSSTTSGMGSST